MGSRMINRNLKKIMKNLFISFSFFAFQELVGVVKISETTVSSLTEEVEMRRKEVEKCREQLASENGQHCLYAAPEH